MADQSIPTLSQIIGPGIDALVALRPQALAFINGGVGRYADIFAIWRAQAALVNARLADELKSSRLPLSEGRALRDLVSSELNTLIQDPPTFAIGTVTLVRSTGGLTGGKIDAGKRFVRNANPSAVPLPLEAAEYEVTETAVVAPGANTITVKVKSTRTGAHANIVQETGVTPGTDLTISTALFDVAFTVQSATAAGGGNALVDPEVRALASANARGQYGPTKGAVVAGAMQGTGVRKAVGIDNPLTGSTSTFVADVSWAFDSRWSLSAAQSMYDNYVGFGCQATLLPLTNTFIRVAATVQLRNSRFTQNTDDITTAIRLKLRDYFDNRQDFYQWKLATIRGVISRADRRIMTCTSVTVTDRNNVTLSEPVASNTATSAIHYYLNDSALVPTYTAPV